MNKVKLPMFNVEVIQIEGTPKQLKQKVNLLMKKYGCCLSSSRAKTYNELQPLSVPGRCINLIPDIESKNCKETVACVIAINTDARRFHYSKTNKNRVLIDVISHEVRHVVDRIISGHHIEDKETPAYLTGYITSELLIKILN